MEQVTLEEVAEGVCVEMNNWDLIAKLSMDSSFLKLSFLPEQKEITEYESHFISSGTVTKANNTLCRILSILEKERPINEVTTSVISKSKCWVYLFIFLGEQCGKPKSWSSASNVDIVRCIEKEIQRITSITILTSLKSEAKEMLPTIARLLKQDLTNGMSANKSIFGNILRVFREKLRKDDWKYYPSTIFSFQQLLYCVTFPDLSLYIDEILPLILLFIDDYYDEYKLIGLQCLDYAIKNLNKSELLRKNWADVLYSTILRSIAAKEPTIVNEVGSILLQLLKILESSSSIFTKSSRYDETLKQILFTMEFSSDVQLRIIWMPYLIDLVNTIEHVTLRWVDRICQMLLGCTTCNDPVLWMWILKCTDTCIKNTWLKPKSEMFAEIIIRIVFNASVFETEIFTEENQKELYSSAKESLLLLKDCEDYNLVDAQLTEIINCDCKLHPKFLHTLKLMST